MLFQWARSFEIAVTRQDFFGAERFEVVGIAFTAADGRDVIAQRRQNSDRRAAYATAGTRNQNVAVIRMYAAFFQRHHAQHGGKAGGTEDHRFTFIQSVWQRHQPFPGDTRLLSQAAPVVFTHAPAGKHHALAFFKTIVAALAHGTGEVDAWHHREVTHDFAFAGDRQRVFIVNAGPINVYRDIAVGQLVTVDIFDASQSLIVLLFQ
ncbi:hypothetical protein D3C78_992600 [compost metagenome]